MLPHTDTIFHPTPEKRLFLIDLDGTLTRGDSFFIFLKLALPYFRYYFTKILLSPFRFLIYLFRYKHPKEMVFYSLFRHWHLSHLTTIGEKVSQQLEKKLFPLAKQFLRRPRNQQERFIVVSASLDLWVIPFCQRFNLECLCTEVTFKNKKNLGLFNTPNCKGKEKVKRIKKRLNITDYNTILAFGNHPSDIQMLKIATKPYYRPFG